MNHKNSSLASILVLAASLLLTATACKKSNSNSASNAAFSATIHDTAWQSTYGVGVYYQSVGTMQIQGVSSKIKDDSTVLDVAFGPVQVNQPVVTGVTGMDVAYYDQQNTFYWGAGNGQAPGTCTLVVTSFDTVNHKIAGTISGSLYNAMLGASPTDSILLTNGRFNVSYIIIP